MSSTREFLFTSALAFWLTGKPESLVPLREQLSESGSLVEDI